MRKKWSEKDRGDYGKRSGLRKIADAPNPCRHPEHNPPGNIVLDPGTYEYVCPACGKVSRFVVPLITC